MAYDEARQEVVLFGSVSDTWVWNGSAWTQRTNAADPVTGEPPLGVPAPPERAGHAMAYDAARREVVLFGGFGGNPVPGVLGDTWVWDGTTWTQRTPSASPGPRAGHAMAYDPIRQRVILFGGVDRASDPTGRTVPQVLNDTWTWNGFGWERSTRSGGPTARVGHAMAFGAAVRDRTLDTVTNRWIERETFEGVILFGGRTRPNLGGGALDDMWVWTWDRWFNQTEVLRQRTGTEAASPSARSGHAMAYDSQRQELVVVGGFAGSPSPTVTAVRDTWVWGDDPVTREVIWEQDTAFPQARAGHAMAYDAARKQFVLVGGGDPTGLSPQGSPLISGPDDSTWIFTRADEGDHGTVPLHRLYNGAKGAHLYTVSPGERDAAVKDAGYVSEGIAAYVWDRDPELDELAPLSASIEPLYRLENDAGDHFYTVDAAERDAAIQSLGYVSEGIAAYVVPATP
jgi:hypothetical protein